MAVRARHGLGASGRVVDGNGSARGEQELEAAQWDPLGGMKEAEGAHPVKAAKRDVREEAAQKLVSGQSHALALAVAAVSVVEDDGAVVAGGDGLVVESGAMAVAGKVVEDDTGARNGLGEDDPALAPGDDRQLQAGHGAASEMEEASSKELRQGSLGHEEGLLAARRSEPGQPIGGETTGGREQVDVRVPLEGARPGVQHGESADVPAEPVRVGTRGGERVERGAEQRAEERLLVLAHGAAELCRQGEDDVEVRHGQEQLALALEPALGGAVAAASERAIAAVGRLLKPRFRTSERRGPRRRRALERVGIREIAASSQGELTASDRSSRSLRLLSRASGILFPPCPLIGAALVFERSHDRQLCVLKRGADDRAIRHLEADATGPYTTAKALDVIV
ncbi:MAG: hypothetical protein RL685_6970 [Pseudomonadota bacterium]